MSHRLLIDSLSEDLQKEAEVNQETNTEEIEKQAEEEAMQKIAEEINTLDQSRVLIAIGEDMFKIAEELENEGLKALAADTYSCGERMGICLTKTASESGAALEEALEIAEDVNKIAQVFASLADEVEEEQISKMASAIIEISNELTEEANEFYKQAAEETENTETENTETENTETENTETENTETENTETENVNKEAGVKEVVTAAGKKVKDAVTGKGIKDYLKKVESAGHGPKTLTEKIKFLATHEKGRKAALPTVAAAGAAAALAAHGYNKASKK